MFCLKNIFVFFKAKAELKLWLMWNWSSQSIMILFSHMLVLFDPSCVTHLEWTFIPQGNVCFSKWLLYSDYLGQGQRRAFLWWKREEGVNMPGKLTDERERLFPQHTVTRRTFCFCTAVFLCSLMVKAGEPKCKWLIKFVSTHSAGFALFEGWAIWGFGLGRFF